MDVLAWMYVCVSHAYSVLRDQKTCQVPWNWTYSYDPPCGSWEWNRTFWKTGSVYIKKLNCYLFPRRTWVKRYSIDSSILNPFTWSVKGKQLIKQINNWIVWVFIDPIDHMSNTIWWLEKQLPIFPSHMKMKNYKSILKHSIYQPW